MTLILGTGFYVWMQPPQQPAEVGMLICIGQMGKLKPWEARRLAGDDMRVNGNVRNLLEFLA